ncbi:hypothetical protein SUNI508_08713 [Seiridium unicorne]|uniref:Uncharacterized protein n=1 Tax=Seiridium unicorne TaxID=138068 RepID=A0ABR2USB1_9PEZI
MSLDADWYIHGACCEVELCENGMEEEGKKEGKEAGDAFKVFNHVSQTNDGQKPLCSYRTIQPESATSTSRALVSSSPQCKPSSEFAYSEAMSKYAAGLCIVTSVGDQATHLHSRRGAKSPASPPGPEHISLFPEATPSSACRDIDRLRCSGTMLPLRDATIPISKGTQAQQRNRDMA